MAISKQEPMRVLTNLPDDLYTGIGMVVVQFSYLEWILTRIIYDLKGLKTAVGRQQTVGRPAAKEQLKLIFQLVEEKGLTIAVDRQALSDRANEYEGKRDLLAHAIFVQGTDGVLRIRDAKRGKKWQPPRRTAVDKSIEPSGESIDPATVVGLAGAIATINRCLEALWREISPQLPSSSFGKM